MIKTMEINTVEIPESVRVKLTKLRELALRGVGGEQANAQRMLESLCSRYGITVEEMFEDVLKPREFHFRSTLTHLFMQTWTSVYGANARLLHDLRIYTVNGSYTRIEVPMTEAEYIEFSQLWDWHSANFKRERRRIRKLFESAYIERYNLYPCGYDDEYRKFQEEKSGRKKETDIEELLAINSISSAITKNNPHKQLER